MVQPVEEVKQAAAPASEPKPAPAKKQIQLAPLKEKGKVDIDFLKAGAPTEAIKIEYPNLVEEEAKIQAEKKKVAPLPKLESKTESAEEAES